MGSGNGGGEEEEGGEEEGKKGERWHCTVCRGIDGRESNEVGDVDEFVSWYMDLEKLIGSKSKAWKPFRFLYGSLGLVRSSGIN